MGCDIHLYMERKHKGKWVVVNAPPHEGEVDYRKDYPWGAWVEVNEIEELAQSLLPLEDRVPTRAQEWAFGRNYDSFGRLSGVRRDNQYREPNGIPKDISEQVWVDWGEDENGLADWHTPTHWTLEDLDVAHSEAGDEDGYGRARISELLQEMWRVAREYNLEPGDVRVVLWYDN